MSENDTTLEAQLERLRVRAMEEFLGEVRGVIEHGGYDQAGRLRDALRHYDEKVRCNGRRMARCTLLSGHDGKCRFEVDAYEYPQREPGRSAAYGRCTCDAAGKWGATGLMPVGHIWQWIKEDHTAGYLAHIPIQAPEREPGDAGGGWTSPSLWT